MAYLKEDKAQKQTMNWSMFDNPLNLAKRRNALQAIGFYIIHAVVGLIILALCAAMGILIVLHTKATSWQSHHLLITLEIATLTYAGLISGLVIFAKKRNATWVIITILSLILASLLYIPPYFKLLALLILPTLLTTWPSPRTLSKKKKRH